MLFNNITSLPPFPMSFWLRMFLTVEASPACKNNPEGEGSSGRCWWPNVTYELACSLCKEGGKKAVYVGETKNGYQRMKQHAAGLRKKKKDSALYKHNMEQHRNLAMEMKDWEVRVTGRYEKPLQRQAGEASTVRNIINQQEMGKRDKEVMLLNSL